LQSNDSWNKIKAEVHQDSGKLGVEFAINKTIHKFKKGAKKFNLNYAHSFLEFKNVLLGQYKIAWKQVVQKHFPEPTDLDSQARLLKCDKLPSCMELFIINVLHKKKPQD
jgi:hypothetical protein